MPSSRAQPVAPVGRAGQPGSLAHGRRQAPGDRRSCARNSGSSEARGTRRDLEPSGKGPRRTSTPPSTRIGAICCGWCSRPCHPVLSTRGARGTHAPPAGGLTTDEIARRTWSRSRPVAPAHRPGQADPRRQQVPFEVPRGAELAERLASVLEGHLPDLQRGLHGGRRRRLDAGPALCEEALRLGRILPS